MEKIKRRVYHIKYNRVPQMKSSFYVVVGSLYNHVWKWASSVIFGFFFVLSLRNAVFPVYDILYVIVPPLLIKITVDLM